MCRLTRGVLHWVWRCTRWPLLMLGISIPTEEEALARIAETNGRLARLKVEQWEAPPRYPYSLPDMVAPTVAELADFHAHSNP